MGLAGFVALAAMPRVEATPIDYETVPVGQEENLPDPMTGFGAADNYFLMGKHLVTVAQYTHFLNAVARTDTHGLYDSRMASDMNVAGIARTGTPGSYTYSVIGNGSSNGNRPITYVSWFDAARFANWMHNGQDTGETETGAYTLHGVTSGTAPAKNAGAKFYIPTENEWYKAAFYDPTLNDGVGGYWNYATRSNTAPGNTPGGQDNQANYRVLDRYAVTKSTNYSSTQNYLTAVGAFENSGSYYGTFDQSGNVFEWNDLDGSAGDLRGLRGGGWQNSSDALSRHERYAMDPLMADSNLGFRLVAVPEPATWLTGLAGLACGGLRMLARRSSAGKTRRRNWRHWRGNRPPGPPVGRALRDRHSGQTHRNTQPNQQRDVAPGVGDTGPRGSGTP